MGQAGVTPALVVAGLTKRFGATLALSAATLEVAAGQVHGLIGENGSGKSTLVKILCGYHVPDGGQVTLWGRALAFPAPAGSGIAVVHQDLGLVDTLSVLENIAVAGGFGGAGLGPVPWRRLQAEIGALMADLGIDLPLQVAVGSLTRAQQALAAIVRALRLVGRAAGGALLILDEPTASLSSAEAERIFDVLRQLARRGNSVIYISHKLSEVVSLCDHVTVLRDGRTVASVPTADADTARLAELMIGGRLEHLATERNLDAAATVVLKVRGLAGAGVAGLDLVVQAGHIMGVTGLVGMGQDDVPHLVYGSRHASRGSVHMDGVELSPLDIRTCQAHGLFIVPADRRGEGLWVEATAAENMALPLEGRSWRGWRSAGQLAERALGQMRPLHVRPLDPLKPVSAFSGGNQQKVLLGKWLQMGPRALVLHEPTQGVDVGAKREIHEIIRGLAEAGVAVCICSSDHEELAALCDGITVLRHGRVAQRLTATEVSLAGIVAAINDGSADGLRLAG
jgi:ribose transport system ATP-binding protein